MSKLISFKKIDMAAVHAHGEKILSELCASEAYTEVAERAAALGVEISLSLRDTYTDLKKYAYKAPKDAESVPYGYGQHLCLDIVRGGAIVFIVDEDGNPEQLSVSFVTAATADTLLLRRLELFELEDVDGEGNIVHFAEEFLDRLEEAKGGTVSLLSANFSCPDVPSEGYDPILRLSDLPEEDVVELIPGAFGGTYVNEGSLFFTLHGFAPYALLLESRRFGFFTAHGVSVIDPELWEIFAEDIRGMIGRLDRELSFADVLTSLGLYSLEPTDRAEKILSSATVLRASAARQAARRLLEFGQRAIEESGTISILWP